MFDVLIVGAGPAGSATAWRLARQGVQVAVADRAAFPRDKACGDMLSGTALRCLARMGLGRLFAGRTSRDEWRADFNSSIGKATTYRVARQQKDGLPRWATVPRLELDASLLRHAQAAGATVYERATVEEVLVEQDQARVKASGISGGELCARLLIIAQGSIGKFVRGAAGYFALRGYYSGPSQAPLALRFTPDLSPGYEWQFPVGERYNIGVYTTAQRAKARRLDQRLAQASFTHDKQLAGQLRGAYLNTSFGHVSPHAERTLWVGDAAGLVQAHLGEGIAPALQSAEIAAECAVTALAQDRLTVRDLSVYTQRLHVEFDGEMRLSHLLSWFMHRPRLLRILGDLLASNYDRLSALLASHTQPLNAEIWTRH
jgi:geranylgeranyl reductase family protein